MGVKTILEALFLLQDAGIFTVLQAVLNITNDLKDCTVSFL